MSTAEQTETHKKICELRDKLLKSIELEDKNESKRMKKAYMI